MSKARTARQRAASRRNLAKARARRVRNKRIVTGALVAIGAASAASQLAAVGAERRGRRALYGKQKTKPSRAARKRHAAHDAHIRKVTASRYYNNGRVRSTRGASRPLNTPKAITGGRTRAL